MNEAFIFLPPFIIYISASHFTEINALVKKVTDITVGQSWLRIRPEIH
jgi:hypothetical protein